MKIFSGTGLQKPLDRATAWGCCLSNQLFLPGAGSMLAGRKVGYIQALGALAGMGLSLVGLALIARTWLHTKQLPTSFNWPLKTGVIGVVLFSVCWLWALATSLSMLREARKNFPRTSVPPQTNR